MSANASFTVVRPWCQLASPQMLHFSQVLVQLQKRDVDEQWAGREVADIASLPLTAMRRGNAAGQMRIGTYIPCGL